MTIQIPEDEVAYLRFRLQQTRWPPPVASSGWDAGTDADYLRALADHWASHYNWREREARLNRFNHFIAEVILMPLRDGVTIPAPCEWAEGSFNVKRWTIMERGGHFAEWKVPHEVANDLRRFFAEVI